MQGYKITTDNNDLDFEVIYSFISNSYWAKGVPQSTLKKALENSLCFGVYKDNGEQVGFARMITDRATFAYLADVFILDSYRGVGLSKWLMSHIVGHSDLQGLRRIMLATSDAHGLYQQYGFKGVDHPETLMQILQSNIYQA